MYQALYRKWRPKTFDDVVGQQHITMTLASEVESGNISHAYLFTGTRGTGKTTCAKILAKAVNCLNPQNGSPCNVCEICTGIESGAVMDIAELDAASNNGVDDIRAMIDETNFTPVKATFRVYIIDEVHMLSPQASNAFLKTLEEPPSHIIFILATTDPQKLLPTVRSRCQRFDFRRIGPEDIAKRLAFIAEQEGFSLDEDAGALIARIADGGLRDAVSLLDLCATTDKNITLKTVGIVAGIADKAFLFVLADCVKTGDAGKALELINDLHSSYSDMGILCSELINHFRSLMLIKTLPSARDLIVCTKADYDKLTAQAALFSPEEILHAMFLLEDTSLNLTKGYNKRTELELAFIRLCTPSLNDGKDAVIRRLAALEAAAANGTGFVSAPPAMPTVVSAALPQETKEIFDLAEPLRETPESFDIPAEKDPETADAAPLAGQFSLEMPPEAAEPAEPEPVEAVMQTRDENENQPEEPGADNDPPEEPCSAPGIQEPLDGWQSVLAALFEGDKPLWGTLTKACAYVENGVLFLGSENIDAAEELLKTWNHLDILKKLIADFCGLSCEIRFVKTKIKDKKAPLQGVASSINFLNKFSSDK